MVFSRDDKALIRTCFEEKGWRGQQICKEFPRKKWSRSSVNYVISNIERRGTIDRKPGSGRPKTAAIEENIEAVSELTCSQENRPGTHLSQRKIAEDLGVGRSSIQRIQRRLGLKAFKRIKVSTRDATVRQKRKTRCRYLLDKFSKNDIKRIVFSDEKDFTLEIAQNHHNDVVYGTKKKLIHENRLYRCSSRFSRKVMVLGGVSWNGKTRLHFIEEKSVNSQTYLRYLQEQFIPDFCTLYPDHNYIFQQDGATAHTSKICQNYLKLNANDFIDKDHWPPQSPDCNPMDYGIWNLLAQKVYANQREKFTIEELKAKIRECWDDITLEHIRKCISKWKKRLRAVVNQDGGNIEHTL